MAEHEPCIGATSDWYTPPEYFEALGLVFDLDPCSPGPGHWVPARKIYTKEDDGLRQDWGEGVDWLNNDGVCECSCHCCSATGAKLRGHPSLSTGIAKVGEVIHRGAGIAAPSSPAGAHCALDLSRKPRKGCLPAISDAPDASLFSPLPFPASSGTVLADGIVGASSASVRLLDPGRLPDAKILSRQKDSGRKSDGISNPIGGESGSRKALLLPTPVVGNDTPESHSSGAPSVGYGVR